MNKVILILVMGLLTSCASHQDRLSEYMSLSERALCISYYEILVSGKNHPAKLEAIEKRSIDCQPYEKEGLLAGKRRNEYYQGLKDNLDHLGSSSTGQTVCTTQRIGTSGVAKTTCRKK